MRHFDGDSGADELGLAPKLHRHVVVQAGEKVEARGTWRGALRQPGVGPQHLDLQYWYVLHRSWAIVQLEYAADDKQYRHSRLHEGTDLYGHN